MRPGLWSVPTPIPNHPLRYVLTYAMEYDGVLPETLVILVEA